MPLAGIRVLVLDDEPLITLDIATILKSAGDVVIVWTENGGPPIRMSQGKAGFGSKLVNKQHYRSTRRLHKIRLAWGRRNRYSANE